MDANGSIRLLIPSRTEGRTDGWTRLGGKNERPAAVPDAIPVEKGEWVDVDDCRGRTDHFRIAWTRGDGRRIHSERGTVYWRERQKHLGLATTRESHTVE